MKETRGLRSNFLVHWTGKDIQTDHENLCQTQRELYVHRLHTTLDGGLWMMPVEEKFKLDIGLELSYADILATCFTEIKLSATNKHTQAYGCLGFGFKRSFVIDKSGGAVHYVSRNSPILRNMESLFKNLETKAGKLLYFNFCFLKYMSDCPECSEDFVKLDEAEWRILLMEDHEKLQPNVVYLGNSIRPNAKVEFSPCELKILILPDDETRKMALDDGRIWDWLSRDRSKLPVITTVKECLQF